MVVKSSVQILIQSIIKMGVTELVLELQAHKAKIKGVSNRL